MRLTLREKVAFKLLKVRCYKKMNYYGAQNPDTVYYELEGKTSGRLTLTPEGGDPWAFLSKDPNKGGQIKNGKE